MANSMFNISKLLNENTVLIPVIQRDYAQGRDNEIAKQVRNKLLDDIYDVLQGKETQYVLNYIYGVPTDDEEIILIDGQQRVTTLFLLKWYLAVKSGLDISFLDRLKYATRDSSEEFCDFLKKNGDCIENNGKPSENITNHIKFKKKWLNDPTIANMLNMLDAIDDRPSDNPDKLYMNIDNIKFSFISLDGFKRTEELYAAMNSRGKQLTPFELIKGELLKADSSLASAINGGWMPAFWEMAKKYAGKKPEYKGSLEEYAASYHDPFLFNFYSFVVQMIWWTKTEDAKHVKNGNSLPSVTEMTRAIIGDDENREFIKYAMALVQNGKLVNYQFDELVRDNEKIVTSHDKVVLFDGRSGDEVNFFDLCCLGGKEFTQAGRCYLWAYIRYQYDCNNNSIAGNRSLIDYYLLMRALYMKRASNETPISVDKLSLNEELMGDVIRPFEEILCKNNDYKDWSQFKAFYSDESVKYEILNNPFVRGVTDNIGEISNDYLNYNLAWMWNASDVDRFKRLATCGFGEFKCEFAGYAERVFLPVSKKMVKSLFSIRSWSWSQNFINFLDYIKTNKLDIVSDSTYAPSEWQYYIIAYDSFRAGVYGQYDTSENGPEMSFDAIYIENQRATKNMIHHPFLYEVYMKKKDSDVNYNDFVKEKEFSFKKNEAGEYEWNYNGNSYPADLTKDCIEDFISKIGLS